MEIDTRKARVKSLKRILNCLAIEIKEINTRGLADTDDLDQAQASITRFCEKIWPFSSSAARPMHDRRIVHIHQHQHSHRNAAPA